MKLKDLVKESKYLKREFGSPLPTLDDVMKQHPEEIKEGKFEVYFDLDPDASPAQRMGLMSVEVTAKDKKEAEKLVASKFVGGMKLIKKSKTKKLKEEILKEAPKDKSKAAKLTQRLTRNESKLRDTMKQLMQLYNSDEVNKKLSQDLESAYKRGVTKFMRTAISILKKVK